ncbi:MAG: fasciclin domain-containing protein [Paludibacter sp.]|nr:fasciclin domain-containing protein [Paludibacter sp.]
MSKNKFIALAFLLVGLMVFYSCQDEQNDHYARSKSLPDKNLYELIKLNPDLSTFSKLIEIAGYDSLLKSSQTYTVWAPVNAGLTDINLTTIDKVQARLIVNNHIARFNNSTSIAPGQLIRMKNYKVYTFLSGSSTFGGSELITHDILARNGVLHTIKNQIVYHNNLYEYVLSSPNVSKLSAFIQSFEEKRFDPTLSIPIDIDKNGRTVYDSITTSYNRLFNNNLGLINTEDSIYTMLIPSDKAWDAAYARISPYFKTYNSNQAHADSVRNIQTSLAILNDLIYRGKIENPASFDSIVSTSGSVIHNPANLFSGTEKKIASNGLVYLTDDLKYNNVETWNKNIILECEAAEGRVAGPNTGIFTRTVTSGSIIPVSDFRYIEVVPNTTSAQPAVTFDIPNVLSGKYDIYVEFIPGSIDGTPRDSTKLLFDLTYLTVTGATTNETVKLSTFVTSGTQKVKMKVFSGYEFPVSNYYDLLWWVAYKAGLHSFNEHVVTTKLMVKTNVSTSELNNNIFTRKFRIDRVIFEAVSN